MEESKKKKNARGWNHDPRTGRFCSAAKKRRNKRGLNHDPVTGRFCSGRGTPASTAAPFHNQTESINAMKKEMADMPSGSKTRAAMTSGKKQRADTPAGSIEVQEVKPRAPVIVDLVSDSSGDEVSFSGGNEVSFSSGDEVSFSSGDEVSFSSSGDSMTSVRILQRFRIP